VSTRPRTDAEIRALRHVSLAEWGELLRASKRILADSNQDARADGDRRGAQSLAHRPAAPQRYFDGDEPRDLLRDRPLLTPTPWISRRCAQARGGARWSVRPASRALRAELGALRRAHPPCSPTTLTWVGRSANRQTHESVAHPPRPGVLPHEEVLVHCVLLGHLGVPQSAFIVLFGAWEAHGARSAWRTLRLGLRAAYTPGVGRHRCGGLLGATLGRTASRRCAVACESSPTLRRWTDPRACSAEHARCDIRPANDAKLRPTPVRWCCRRRSRLLFGPPASRSSASSAPSASFSYRSSLNVDPRVHVAEASRRRSSAERQPSSSRSSSSSGRYVSLRSAPGFFRRDLLLRSLSRRLLLGLLGSGALAVFFAFFLVADVSRSPR